MKVHTLSELGAQEYKIWLESRTLGEMPPQNLLNGKNQTEELQDVEVDINKKFKSRFDFGGYIVERFGDKLPSFLSSKFDGIWDWLTIAYFSQFGGKKSKYWHYVVTRKGHKGSLAYRHLARTSAEMYWRHGLSSQVMLSTDLATWGEMSEQLTSRQNIAYHRACINAANALYLKDGKLRRGSAGRVPPRAKRKPGDRKGKGGAGRLALAVRRLGRTYDTHDLDAVQMVELLPREFSSFKPH
jgi:hypothetical protein